jgi:hypothetical protein
MDSAIRRLALAGKENRSGRVPYHFSSPRRCRKRGSDRLLDLPQHFSGGDKQGCRPVKDKEPQQRNRDKIAATAAVQRRCWRGLLGSGADLALRARRRVSSPLAELYASPSVIVSTKHGFQIGRVREADV